MEFLGLRDLTAGKKIIAENFANWTSGNEIIDNFIKEKQLKYGGSISRDKEAVFEWIPYNEFIDIKEIGKNCFATAIWKEDTKVYILVYNEYFNYYCEKCDNKYDDSYYKWCKECQINQLKNNFTNWTSGNIKLDDFIQKMQLKIYKYNILFEWIPYNEFIIIEGLENYTLAIWKKGPLYCNTNDKKLVRKSHEKVYLKYLYNSQEITAEFSNEVESHLKNDVIFGISQNPDTKVYVLVFDNKYFNYYCEKCDNKYDN
ncbi:hypothetical protein RhiirC2_789729 [Rhizophagus irregularis]|uniref:Uncharacterized protein n=1 Tax=Rhizophagus irregularis TaxID=588596 RepID=A0A2N1MMK0_9GLOM|nr:hypothetical protein RhiirC2_789729 [Rhizophagus irregularis]